jgi:hypothetical protein
VKVTGTVEGNGVERNRFPVNQRKNAAKAIMLSPCQGR